MTDRAPMDTEVLDTFLAEMVRTPSPTGHEGEVAELIQRQMEALGFTSTTVDRAGSVVGRLGTGEPPILVFNGHMDHVGVGDRAAWAHDPFGGVIEDGVLFGRGACDMKGGLAALIHGAGSLVASRRPLRGTLYIVCVVQEETCEGLAMRLWMEQAGVQPDWVVLAEPSDLRVALGHPGRLELRLRTHGRIAHGSAPERGENAIYSMARLAVGIEALNKSLTVDPLLGKASISLDVIAGGADLNVVPDRCEALVDRRLTRGESDASAVSQLRDVAAGAGVAADIEVIEYAMPSYNGYVLSARQAFASWHTPADHPLAQAVSRAAVAVTGRAPETHVWAFSTDGAYTAGVAGIPTVGFGPGEERYAHTALDQVRLADVQTAARVYARLAADLLGA